MLSLHKTDRSRQMTITCSTITLFFLAFKKMFLAAFTLGFVMSPPKSPPAPGLTTFGGGDDWKITQVTLQDAAEILTKFSKTYDLYNETPDFSCNPLKITSYPQGILGLRKLGEIRLLCHFVEKDIGTASITSIATAFGEYEAGTQLFECISRSEALLIDEATLKDQPRWHLSYKFYTSEAL